MAQCPLLSETCSVLWKHVGHVTCVRVLRECLTKVHRIRYFPRVSYGTKSPCFELVGFYNSKPIRLHAPLFLCCCILATMLPWDPKNQKMLVLGGVPRQATHVDPQLVSFLDCLHNTWLNFTITVVTTIS